LQVAVLPLASVAVAVTVVVPTPNTLPDAGLADIPNEQLSLPVGVKLTTALHNPASVLCTMFSGQVTVGAWVSFTVTVKLQVAVLPLASVAVAVTVVVPTPNTLPEAGLLLMPNEQLSLPVGVKFTTAVHKPESVFWVRLSGQVILGAWVSFTVTVKLQVAVLPLASVAVAVTVVAPTPNTAPEAGLLLMPNEQLSLPVGVKFTTALHKPASVLCTMFSGQVTVGACVSFTVTVKLQVAVLPLASVAVAVTVVVPTANTLPDAGLADIPNEQLSLPVGVKFTTALHNPASVFCTMFSGQVILGA